MRPRVYFPTAECVMNADACNHIRNRVTCLPMDEFEGMRLELTTENMTVEVSDSGRIEQFWISDNDTATGGESQFVLSSLYFSDENSSDYLPGTILLATRSDPDGPWISSRTTGAELLDDADGLTFRYEFSLIDDLAVQGKFHPISGQPNAFGWEIQIRNASRQSIELGELGFPFALTNGLFGYTANDEGTASMFADTVHVHKFIGGAASYIHATRLNGRAPGLLITPGGDSTWEFTHNVRASLTDPRPWDGIPVVYAHSRATIDREGWSEWVDGHTSLVLEPRETRTYRLVFGRASRDRIDGVQAEQQAAGRPFLQLYPAAVAPASIGIAMEVSGCTPTRFDTDRPADTETDSDSEGGFCFVRPQESGPLRLSLEDTEGRYSHAHLLFLDPIEELIQRRADWICRHQVCAAPGPWHHAILPTDLETGEQLTDPELFTTTSGIENSLADALFLAQKNVRFPVREQIRVLNRYVHEWLERYIVNPGDGSVGSARMDPRGIATFYGRAAGYPLVGLLYLAMADIAETYGGTQETRGTYLEQAALVAEAMFRFVHPEEQAAGQILLPEYADLAYALWAAEQTESAQRLATFLQVRTEEFNTERYPFRGAQLYAPETFREVYENARRRGNDPLQNRALRLAMASKSLAPSWWWYGSSKRFPGLAEPAQALPEALYQDKGELCHGAVSVSHCLMALDLLQHDATRYPKAYLQAAFGGLLGVWSLVRPDGAASQGYCPDPASEHFGMVRHSGDVGVGLYLYLRHIAAYVLPSLGEGLQTFGCTLDAQGGAEANSYLVRPWDGVGARVVLRQIGFEASLSFGRIEELELDSQKRAVRVRITNPCDKGMPVALSVRGLWGKRFRVNGEEAVPDSGELRCNLQVPPFGTVTASVNSV